MATHEILVTAKAARAWWALMPEKTKGTKRKAVKR